MDAASLKRAALAARTFIVEHGGRAFELRLPSRHEVQVAWLRAGVKSKDDTAGLLVAGRDLVERAVVGWSRVTVGDILPDVEDTSPPVEFDRDLVPVLLDGHEDIAQALLSALNDRLVARRAKGEAIEKNSPSDGPGPAAVATE